MINSDERRARAIRAKIFMDSDEVRAAFDEIETEIKTDWSKAHFQRRREELWRQLNTIQKLRTKLAAYAGQAPKD